MNFDPSLFSWFWLDPLVSVKGNLKGKLCFVLFYNLGLIFEAGH